MSDEYGRALDRIGWRLDALDLWRASVDKRIGALEGTVAELVNADKIASGVADELTKRRVGTQQVILTRAQLRVGWAAVVVTGIGSICGVLALIIHL